MTSDIKERMPVKDTVDYKEIPSKLKKIIQDSGLSLPAFAEKVGVSRNTLVSYRDGQTSPSMDFIAKVCDEFYVSPIWLISDKGEPYRFTEYSETPFQDDVLTGKVINVSLLIEIIKAIENKVNDNKLTLSPEKKSLLISILYEQFIISTETVDDNTVDKYLKLAT